MVGETFIEKFAASFVATLTDPNLASFFGVVAALVAIVLPIIVVGGAVGLFLQFLVHVAFQRIEKKESKLW